MQSQETVIKQGKFPAAKELSGGLSTVSVDVFEVALSGLSLQAEKNRQMVVR